MIGLLNQFSYPLFAVLAVGLIFLLLRLRFHARWRYVLAAEALTLLMFAAGFAVLHPGAGDVADLDAAEAVIANGRPTFVEFFSNFCTGCLVIRPSVDQFVDGIQGDFNILRINIHTPLGRELTERYGFSFTPEFIVFDAAGGEIWRAHALPAPELLRTALQP